ncbi:peptidase E [Catenulispora pinisilvae]|uniref:Type 1 glutamine amidotransferase-like domain-containing protein n=1 Tax=Catenulispora pinisilvae TaxID=2705253 RepID=UPI0018911F89|nr:peptidase E [Catenulispora pinisilvae]
MAGHIVATGAGRALMERRTDPHHEFVLRLTGKERPRVLFLPTATGDDPTYIVSFYETYTADRCEPFHLRLFNRTISDLRAFVRSMDVITVGGGNTANMLDVWRRQGLDAILREAWEDGAVLTGGSAGALCWFRGGTTDSFGLPYQVLADGLGLLEGSLCPHYDGQDSRRPVYRDALLSGALPAGYGVDDLVGLHFHGTDFVEAVSSSATGGALRIEAVGGVIAETRIPVRLLPPDANPRPA